MRQQLRIFAICSALLLPCGLLAQRPPDEGQRVRLGITVDQQKRLETILTAASAKRKAVQSRLHSLYGDMHQLYEAYSFNKQQAQQLQDQIVAEHRKMLALYAENEAKLREVLNPVQFDKLRAEMDKERMDRERRRHEHPGPGWNGDRPPGRPEGPEPTPQGVSQRKG